MDFIPYPKNTRGPCISSDPYKSLKSSLGNRHLGEIAGQNIKASGTFLQDGEPREEQWRSKRGKKKR